MITAHGRGTVLSLRNNSRCREAIETSAGDYPVLHVAVTTSATFRAFRIEPVMLQEPGISLWCQNNCSEPLKNAIDKNITDFSLPC